MTDPNTPKLDTDVQPTTEAVATTLDAIDSLITEWQDWEAEDAKPKPKAAQLRSQFDTMRPFFARAAMTNAPAPQSADSQTAAIQDIIDAAIYWTSEDADRPDPASPEWLAVIPLMQGAPAMAQLLRDAQGAMQALRHQVDQMRRAFPDEDGTIQEACDAHDETEEAVRQLLDEVTGATPVAAAPVNATVGTNHYLVGWEIDIWADTPRQAARKALAIQQRPDSTANVFSVTDEAGDRTCVDLEEAEHNAGPEMRGPA